MAPGPRSVPAHGRPLSDAPARRRRLPMARPLPQLQRGPPARGVGPIPDPDARPIFGKRRTCPTRDDPVTAGVRMPTRETSTKRTQRNQLVLLERSGRARKWYQGALDVEPRLAALGAARSDDPAVQFCLNAARRHLGDLDTPRAVVPPFPGATARHVEGRRRPWRDAAAAELWLTDRSGPPPKPVAVCKQTSAKPFLDGNLDDDCWKDAAPIALRDAGGDTAGVARHSGVVGLRRRVSLRRRRLPATGRASRAAGSEADARRRPAGL